MLKNHKPQFMSMSSSEINDLKNAQLPLHQFLPEKDDRVTEDWCTSDSV